MQTDLIVNYLPQTLSDDEFKSMFLSIGPLKNCKIVRDRVTNYSYGFGFVDYKDPAHAATAIDTLNGLQLQNKRIKVAYSRKGENIKNANLYIRGLPRNMNQNQLQQMFSQYGTVINARVLVDNASGQSKGVGFVLFDSKDEAETAMNSLNGSIPEGGSEALNIKFAEENAGKARPPTVMVVNSPPANAWGGGYATGGMGGYGGPMRNRGSNNQRYNPMAGNYGNYGTPNSGLSVIEGGHILFVYNIGPDADERALWNLFAPFGTIQKVNVIRDHARGQGKGFGFVTMTNFHEAEQAILSLNGYRYYGKPLQVSFKS